MEGKVYLVGCGLRKSHLTLEALDAIKKADVVLYDRLVDPEILGLSDAEKIYVGKNPGESGKQRDINAQLCSLAKAGKTVARLKCGDPFIFGRGVEESRYLTERGVEVEVIPGLSAFQILSKLRVPLTYRDSSSSVSLITGARADGSDDFTGLDADVLVFYMPVANLERIIARIKGRSGEPCLIIENGFKDNYRVLAGTVDSIARIAREAEVEAPSLLIVGAKRRISGKRVLTFRQAEREQETKRALEFEVENYPLFEITHKKFKVPKAEVYAFTSSNAVEAVFRQADLDGIFVAIGDKTAESLKKFGKTAEVPKQQTSEGLVGHLKKLGKGCVVFCSPLTRVRGLRTVFVYETHYRKKAPGLLEGVRPADIIFLTSSEIVKHLCGFVPLELLNSKTVVAIGPQTAREAKAFNLHIDITLQNPNIEELNDVV